MSDTPRAPILPKRCPKCKGALIQRMPNPSGNPFVWFRCGFCEYTWKVEIADDDEPRQGR